MHSLLIRQLRKLGVGLEEPPSPRDWQAVCPLVGQAYEEADSDRYLLERSLRISSDEMRTLYEQLASSSRARLRAIAQAVPDMLFLQDEEGTYLEVHAARPENLLLPPEEVLGHLPEELFPPEEARRFRGLLEAALREGAMQKLEYWLELPKGRRLFEARCVPLAYRESGRRTTLTVVHDITEQREEEAWNRLVGRAVSSAQEGILILDEQRGALFANPAWRELSGEGTAELPAWLAGQARLWQAVEERGGWRGELSVPGERWWWVRVERLRLEADRRQYYVILAGDVSELRLSRQELEHLATHDPLTGLPNRVLLRDRLEHALAHARRDGKGGAVLFIDLDRFKGVNDLLGHQAGDRLLQEVAKRLRSRVREVDTLARMGGDEFILLVEGLEWGAGLMALVDNLVNGFKAPFRIDGRDLRISASVGVSLFPEHGEDVDRLLRHADTAMYTAKSAGGSCHRVFTLDQGHRIRHAYEMEQALRGALEENELRLVFQPQYRMRDGRLVGMEALCRWRSPRLGDVPPARFIPLAERSGLIAELGLWVLESVCGNYRAWRQAGIRVPRLGINLSAGELRQQRLLENVDALLNRHGIPAGALEFEITESMILGEDEISRRNLHGLHELGMGLAIDDFGTGHSTLVNLKRLPLGCLKIDASFVRDVGHDRGDEAIIRAIVALASSFDMRTVAEGVEKVAQYEFLRQCGCDGVQGFLCGRPMESEQMGALLAREGESLLRCT